MKTKEFNTIAIGIDEEAQTKYRSNVRLKQRYLTELYSYVSKYVIINDKSSLQGNFYNDFIELFLAKYQSKFPPISVNKMLEAMDVDKKYQDEITKKIASIDIQLDKDFKAKEPDFKIYTENEEQNKLFRTIDRLCKELDSLKTQGIRLTPNNLIHGTQQMISYDWSKQRLKPNTRKILGKDSRG